MCTVNPCSAIALPWSWAVFHLPAIMLSRNVVSEGISEQEKFDYGSFLLYFAAQFCKLVTRIEWEMRYRDMKLTCAGHKFLPHPVVRRRNSDLLATIAMNLGHWPISLRGFSDSLTQIHEVS